MMAVATVMVAAATAAFLVGLFILGLWYLGFSFGMLAKGSSQLWVILGVIKVLMLNDDYTPMEFVVMVLKRYFSMDIDQATQVMLHVHQRGVGVCGIFPYEIAETKVNQVMDFADKNQHPLRCTLEKA